MYCKKIVVFLVLFLTLSCIGNVHVKTGKEAVQKIKEERIDNFISGNSNKKMPKTINDYFNLKTDKYYYNIYFSGIHGKIASGIEKFIIEELNNNLIKNKIDFLVGQIKHFDNPLPNFSKGEIFSLMHELKLGQCVMIIIRRYSAANVSNSVITDSNSIKLEFIYVGEDNIIYEIKPFIINELKYDVSVKEEKIKKIKGIGIAADYLENDAYKKARAYAYEDIAYQSQLYLETKLINWQETLHDKSNSKDVIKKIRNLLQIVSSVKIENSNLKRSVTKVSDKYRYEVEVSVDPNDIIELTDDSRFRDVKFDY